MTESILILTNCRDNHEADFIMEALFAEKLVACVQTNKIHSHYFYNDKIMHDTEIRLLIKTRKELFVECEQLIRNMHSYELPEIVEIPITDGSQQFFDWIDYATKDIVK